MGTNGTEVAMGLGIDEEILRIARSEHIQPIVSADRAQVRKRAIEAPAAEAESARPGPAPEPVESGETFALAPLVNKIAFSMARGLAVALKELEDHIAGETRKLGEGVDRQFDSLQPTLQNVSDFMTAQRAANSAVEARLEQLTSAIGQTDARRATDVEALQKETRDLSASVSKEIELSAISLRESEDRQTAKLNSLRAESTEIIGSIALRLDATVAAHEESDARHAAALAALDEKAKAFSQSMSEKIDHICQELGVHQEDIGAMKESLCTFSSRVQALVERLDRQADTVRSMCSAYSQRELELEQLVDGLARLRSFPTPLPANAL